MEKTNKKLDPKKDNKKGSNGGEEENEFEFDLEKFGKGLVEMGKAQGSNPIGIDTSIPQMNFSDERIKKIFGNHSYPLECFKKLNSYKFVFKKEAQDELGGVGGIDDDEHIGIMAQELEKVPVLGNSVATDKDTGLKTIDTGEMTLANTAALSDVAKEIDAIKEAIEVLAKKIGKGE